MVLLLRLNGIESVWQLGSRDVEPEDIVDDVQK